MSDLERISIHEAAHAVIGLRLGIALGVVSIRPTATYRGICGFSGRMNVAAFDPARPLLAQPARPRRLLEGRMRVSLAGPAADRLWWPSSGFRPTPAPRPAPVVLPPAAAAMLQAIEADEEPNPTDDEKAADYAFILVGPDLLAPYYAFAHAETTEMVADAARPIERLAAALLVHTAMSSRQVRAVVRGDKA